MKTNLDSASLECEGISIEVTRSPEDGALVVQIDTDAEPKLRVYLNDLEIFADPVYPGPREASESYPLALRNLIEWAYHQITVGCTVPEIQDAKKALGD